MQGKPPGSRLTPSSRAWPHRFWPLGLLALGLSACAEPQPADPAKPPVPPLDQRTVRINAGGPTQTVNGVTWLGCENVNACGGYVSGGFASADPSRPGIANVASPASEAMYQSEWSGGATRGVGAGETAFSYHIALPNGPYQVKLHFAEPNKTAPGQRLFDVNLEGGAPELTGYDIYQEAGGELTAAPPEAVYSAVQDGVSAAQPLTVGNRGSAPLRVSALAFGGKDAGAFELVAPPALPLTLAPGQNLTVQARFNPRGAVGALSAALSVKSDDPTATTLSVGVCGLSARGLQGDLEPPLQQIVDTLGYAIDVGGDLVLGTQPTMIGDEVAAGLFTRADGGPVTIKPVARYSPDDLLPFGYYTPGGANPTLHQVAVVARGAQTLLPPLAPGGADSFDPGSATFGFYAGATGYAPQNTFTRDALNTGQTKHGVRVYPLKNRAGQPVANSYLLAFEPAVNGKLYVFGGFDTHLQATKRSDVYDPASNRWTVLPDMPEPSTHVAVAADGQTLYPGADTWTERAPLPGPRKSPVADDFGNRLLVTGGPLVGDATTTTWSGAR